MGFQNTKIPYSKTNSFAPIVLDYIAGEEQLKKFYTFSPDLAGIENAIEARKRFPVDRSVLVNTLRLQYEGLEQSHKLRANLERLANADSYTICTAHQPNIFTGHLYFIYKILHAVRLAEELESRLPGNNFVPVYYMGSEDADLDELGGVEIFGTEYRWKTAQKGAVGRMKIDKHFLELMTSVENRLGAEPFGFEVMKQVRAAYREGVTIAQATFEFVHALFNERGLVILLPDRKEWKSLFIPVIDRELREQFSHKTVSDSALELSGRYKIQAGGRTLNLFYLKDDIRERIERTREGYTVVNTDILFTADEMAAELKAYPERFSPNVVLRPIFQETILPNVAFIGGGGELAYWLELRSTFEAANVFFPPLFLRNSFSIHEKNLVSALKKLQLQPEDIFVDPAELLAGIVRRHTSHDLTLEKEIANANAVFTAVKAKATAVDRSLEKHVAGLEKKLRDAFVGVEKRMLRAEKRKFSVEHAALQKLLDAVRPGGGLQERRENILPYLAVHSFEFLNDLYNSSAPFDHQFTILQWQES